MPNNNEVVLEALLGSATTKLAAILARVVVFPTPVGPKNIITFGFFVSSTVILAD